jgi:hypothetical protein
MTDWASLTVNETCQMKRSGTRCTARATHHWGAVLFCCDHFDEFIVAMFDLNRGLSTQAHRDFVSLFDERTKSHSRLSEGNCSADDRPKDKK